VHPHRGSGWVDDDDCFQDRHVRREGVINAYNYGSQKQRGKKIFVTFELTAEKFIISVRDQGRASMYKMCPTRSPTKTC